MADRSALDGTKSGTTSASCSSAVTIRAAAPGDIPHLCAMTARLAGELGTSEELHASDEDWRRNGFGEAPKFSALIAESDGAPAGMATYSPIYIPDAGTKSLFVHLLFVERASPSSRCRQSAARQDSRPGCRRGPRFGRAWHHPDHTAPAVFQIRRLPRRRRLRDLHPLRRCAGAARRDSTRYP